MAAAKNAPDLGGLTAAGGWDAQLVRSTFQTLIQATLKRGQSAAEAIVEVIVAVDAPVSSDRAPERLPQSTTLIAS